MSRQTRKTRQAIFDAFSRLLNEKKFSTITMQEIADLADVGRSTIYSHFETKEELLSAMLQGVFEEMFASSHLDPDSPAELITMLLEHIKENEQRISGVLASDGMRVFFDKNKNHVLGMIKTPFLISFREAFPEIPEEFLVNHLCGSFIEMVRWWASNKMAEAPEDLARWFVKLTIG